MENAPIKNLTDLFNKQAELYKRLENKEISAVDATEMNNAAGKMIKIASIQALYKQAHEIGSLEILK